MNLFHLATLITFLTLTACGRPELVQENARLKARIASLEKLESENTKLLSQISLLRSQNLQFRESKIPHSDQSNELMMCKSKLSNQSRVAELIALQDDSVKAAKFYCGGYLKAAKSLVACVEGDETELSDCMYEVYNKLPPVEVSSRSR